MGRPLWKSSSSYCSRSTWPSSGTYQLSVADFNTTCSYHDDVIELIILFRMDRDLRIVNQRKEELVRVLPHLQHLRLGYRSILRLLDRHLTRFTHPAHLPIRLRFQEVVSILIRFHSLPLLLQLVRLFPTWLRRFTLQLSPWLDLSHLRPSLDLLPRRAGQERVRGSYHRRCRR